MNLVANTGIQFLGIIAAPVTLLAGPVAGYNFVMTLALATSATAAYFMVRRWTTWRPAAFLGGLLFGFSPYMVGHGTSHANLAFVGLVPLLFLVLAEILVLQRLRPLVCGLLLGLLASAQFFVSSEVLLTAGLLTGLTMAYLVISHRRQVAGRAGYAFRALGTAGAIFACVVAYPAWMGLAGPSRVTGQVQPEAQAFRGNLLGPVVPTDRQLLAPPSLQRVGNRLGGGIIENGAYLGVPLLVTLIVGVAALRRSAATRAVAFLGVAALVLSLGARLLVSARPTTSLAGLPLPGLLLHKLPITREIIPVRFSLYVVLAASLIFGVVIDRLHHRWSGTRRATAAPVAIGVACLLPLVPAWPYATERFEVPAYFSSSALQRIPRDSVALVYPFPTNENPVAMTWQGEARMRFRMVGGYFRVPLPRTGEMTYTGIPSVVKQTLDDLYRRVPFDRSESLRRAILAEMSDWRVQTVIAGPDGGESAPSIEFLTWVLGRPPSTEEGVAVWHGVENAQPASTSASSGITTSAG